MHLSNQNSEQLCRANRFFVRRVILVTCQSAAGGKLRTRQNRRKGDLLPTNLYAPISFGLLAFTPIHENHGDSTIVPQSEAVA